MTDAAIPIPAGNGESLDSAILRLLMETIPDRIYFKNLESRFVRVNAAHARFLGAESPEHVIGKNDFDFFSADHASRALAGEKEIIRSGVPILGRVESITKRDGTKAWGSTTKMPWRDGSGQIIGTFGLTRDVTAAKRAEDKLAERSAEMEADLRVARQIQEAFFPRRYPTFPRNAGPARTGLRFDHRYVAAATLGGDFFHIIPLSDTRCGILVCDVMGHGVRAGLLTALIRGAMEELGPRAGDPAHVLGELNRGLMPIVEQTGQPVFATAFYAVIDLAAGTLCYANAGHPPPFVLRRTRGVVERLALEDPEPATGLVEGFTFSQHDFPFNPGDCLIGFTDGLLEATDPHGEMYGEANVQAVLQGKLSAPSEDLLPRLLAGIEQFSGRSEFEDDLCLLAVWRP
jgi:sigma-B regulation protein RsbU (phosphoserine phosphatase)